jgi:uncharacterized protein YegL
MSGNPIRELNAGLALVKDELSADPLASKRVQIGVVTFGPVETVTDFVDARHWVVPTLAPKGNTPMGAAIEHGLQMIEAQKPGSTAIAMHRSAMEAEFIQGDKRTGNLAGRGADPAKRSSAAPRRF